MNIGIKKYMIGLFIAQAMLNVNANAAVVQDLRYNVYLDGDRIGYHQVSIRQQESVKVVRTEARFNVKFLFFNAYEYQHNAEETWNDRCLTSIRTDTDDNGEKLFLFGRSQQQLFTIKTPQGSDSINGCIRSFAYWDLDMLQASHLLNTQNGQYTAVQIINVGTEMTKIGAKPVQATRYRIVSDEFTIDLWYSRDKEWLALSTATENGSTLRYERE